MSEMVAAGAGTGSEAVAGAAMASAAGSVAEAAAAESASESGASELAAAAAGAARESGTPPQPSHNQTTAFTKTEEEEREMGKRCRQGERKLRVFLWRDFSKMTS